MKSFRWTLLFAIIIAGLLAFTIFDFKRSTKEEKQAEDDKKVLRVKIVDVTRFEFDGGALGPIVLEHPPANGPVESEWQIVSPIKDLADAQAIQTLNISLTGEKIVQTVVEGDDIALETYGLKATPERPLKALKLATKEGKSEEIRIGTVKAYDNNLYAQIDQDKKVFLVSNNWDPLLSKLPKDFRDKHVFRGATNGLKPADIHRIEIKQAGSDLIIERGPKDKKWMIAGGSFDYQLDQSKVDYFFDELKGVRIQDFVDPDKNAKGALAKRGLDKPALEVMLYKNGEKSAAFDLKFSALEKATTTTAAPVAYVVTTDLPDISSVSKPGVDGLRKTAQDFYDKRKPFDFQPDDVDKVEVQSLELTNTFQKNGESWKVVAPAPGKELDGAKVQAAIQHLSHVDAAKILPASTQTAFKSKITFLKKSGEPAFVFQWGDQLIEKGDGSRAETKYVLGKTDRADVVVNVADTDIKQLDLGGWLKIPAAVASPTPSAAAATVKQVEKATGAQKAQ